MKPKNGLLDWVQGLRGIAALLVVLCHGGGHLNGPENEAARNWFTTGAMGVDLFFIISGFIMVYSTRASTGTVAYALDFGIKRFARVWPVYVVITIAWVLSTGPGFRYFHDAGNWVILAKSFAFIPVKYGTILFDPAFGLGWTLDFEMYFYLIFGISLLFGRFRLPVLTIWILLTVVAIPMMSGGFSASPFAFYNFAFRYLNLMANPLVLEFLAGALIAQLYLSPKVRIGNWKVAANMVAIVITGVVFYNYSFRGVFHGIQHWGGALTLLVLVLAITSKTIDFNTPRVLLWIGEISFSLYLTHLLTLHYVDRLMMAAGMGSSAGSWGYLAVGTVACVAMAGVSHHYLEQGLSEYFRRALQGAFRRMLSALSQVATYGKT